MHVLPDALARTTTTYPHCLRRIVRSNTADALAVHRDDEGVGAHMIAAMTAGATSTFVTNPIWVVKTRFMVRRPG